MTTAYTRDNSGGLILDEQRDPDQPAGLYATGAGHVNVTSAMDPGLAFDINKEQYIGYLCSSLGQTAMRVITRNSTGECSDYAHVAQEELNYPSVVVDVLPLRQNHVVVRTLTNLVADGLPEVYKLPVVLSKMVFVDVEPAVLTFTAPGQKRSFSIRVAPRSGVTLIKGAAFEGSIIWSSNRGHVVRSPLLAVVGLDAPPPSTAWKLDD